MQGTNPLTGLCTYSTPCGYCTKWDKKCDKKIGCNNNRPHNAQKSIEVIKSGKLPPLSSKIE